MAKRKPADNSAMKELKQDLASGAPRSLYVLYGEETYLRDYYFGKLREQLVGGAMEEFNLHILSADQVTPRSLEDTIDCLPVMSQRTMIQITDFDLFRGREEDRKEFARILAEIPDYCCVVFVYDLVPYQPDNRTKLAAAIRDHGLAVQFARQEQGDLIDWIRRRFRALGRDITPDVARYLIFQCGDLMNGLIGEIEKVGAYARGARITQQDIDAVVIPQLDAVVFQMTDAISAGNFDKAASVLGDLYQMQEPPVKILFSLGKQIRQIYSARLALEARRGTDYLVQLWGMRSAYPAQKLLDSARRFNLDWCRWAVVRCGEADMAMKSGSDGNEVLTTLLMELSVRRER